MCYVVYLFFLNILVIFFFFFFFQAEDGIRDLYVTGVQTCALPIFCDAGSVGEPPADWVGEKRPSAATEDRYIRFGFRDNTCDHFRNNSSPQRVQIAINTTPSNSVVQHFVKPRATFAFWISN